MNLFINILLMIKLFFAPSDIEYMLATKQSVREGMTITHIMNMRNKNIPSPAIDRKSTRLNSSHSSPSRMPSSA